MFAEVQPAHDFIFAVLNNNMRETIPYQHFSIWIAICELCSGLVSNLLPLIALIFCDR